MIPLSPPRAYLAEITLRVPEQRLAMIRSLKTMVRSRDLGASRAFYVDLLGLRVEEEWDSPADRGFIVSVGPEGGFLEFLQVDPEHHRHRPDHLESVANDKIEVQLQVESVDSWADRLAEHLEEGPASRPWGNRYLWLRDPDGLRVALFEGPQE